MSENDIENQKKRNSYLVPGAIILAGALVSVAIIFKEEPSNAPLAVGSTEIEESVLPVTREDHIFGSEDADVFFIEYSDFRCGYCGLFHDTIEKVLEEYDGRVAWVYRHTPYQPGGREAAIASECVAEQLGEDGFWDYTKLALSSQRELSDEWHVKTAVELGADKDEFETCKVSGKYDELLAAHTVNAQALGGQGTPFNVLVTRDGGMIRFSGAQSFANVKILVDRALKTLE